MVIAGQSSPEEEALAVARQHADWGRQVRLGGCGVHLRARPRLAFHIPVVR